MNTMTLNLNEREMAVVEELAAKHDLSKTAIIRQALRLYQLVDREYERGGHMTLASDADNRRLMFVGLGWPLQALQQAREGWQPIETAPRTPTDDTWSIIGYCPNSRRRVRELVRCQDYEGGPWNWSTPHGATGRGYIVLWEAITHWMPLPAPPILSPDPSADVEGG